MLKRLYVPDGRPALTIWSSYQQSTSSQSHMAICAPILQFLQGHQAVCLLKGIQWWWSDPTCHAPAYFHDCQPYSRTQKSIEGAHEEATLGPLWCNKLCVQTIDNFWLCCCILWLVSSHGHEGIAIHQQNRETWNFQRIYHFCRMMFRKTRLFFFFLQVTA